MHVYVCMYVRTYVYTLVITCTYMRPHMHTYIDRFANVSAYRLPTGVQTRTHPGNFIMRWMGGSLLFSRPLRPPHARLHPDVSAALAPRSPLATHAAP